MKTLEDFFKPLPLSVRECLTDSGSLYQIPDYQRPYKWTTREVEKLWEDVYEAYEKSEKSYFLGTITTASLKENAPYRDVIDGQQRLTTLIILCCVVRDMYPGINSTKEFSVDKEVLDNAIFYGQSQSKKVKRVKLCTHDRVQTEFDANIIGPDATQGLKQPTRKAMETDDSKPKFINTAVFFRGKFRALGEDKAGDFIKFLFDSVGVIRIDCPNTSSAIKIFQSINATGIDLTSSDLIKSFLLGEVEQRYRDSAGDLLRKRGQFVADWNDMEKNAQDCASNMEELLTAYEYYALAKNPDQGLHDEMQAVFKDKDPNKVAGDLKQFIATYKQEIYNVDDKIIYSLWYLPWSMHWKSILLAACLHRPADFAKLAKALRRFYYAYWVGGKTLSRIKQTSFNLIRLVKDKNESIESIKKAMQKKMDDDEIDADARKHLVSDDIAGAAWCKPLLLLMEYATTDNSKLSFIEMDKKLHLEHVLPVEYRESEWGHISDQVAKKYLQSAGNLTLLSGRKNIIASNDSFDRKIRVYKGLEGDKRMTALEITRKIVDDYDHDRYKKQWNEDSMRDRKRWFLEEAENILEIGINPENPENTPSD